MQLSLIKSIFVVSLAAGGRGANSDEDRKPTLEDDMCSEGSGAQASDAPRLATEELLAEAAMRQALAAEKQAEAVAQVNVPSLVYDTPEEHDMQVARSYFSVK